MRDQKKLLQLLNSNQGKNKQPLKVVSAANEATIYLYDVIDEYWGVSAKDIAIALGDLKGIEVTLRINSPGGDVFAGRAIATAIKQHGNVTAQIDGIAASAATYVALAAKETKIADGGFFMIHNAWTFGGGDKNDFIELATLLESLDQTIINDYVAATGKSDEEIRALMDAETWFTAKEAVDNNFIDSVFNAEPEGDDQDAKNKWDLDVYNNVPKTLNTPPPQEPPAAPAAPEPPNINPSIAQHAQAARRLQLLNAS